MKKGQILSEIQFYTIKEVENDYIVVVDDNGNEITIAKEYAEKLLNSADSYTKEEKLTATQLSEKFISSTRIAMTVCYVKKDEDKKKKDFKDEKDKAFLKIENEKDETKKSKLIRELIENPILSYIPGEERIMKGRHYGHINDFGRVSFIDMEVPKKEGAFDNRERQVDPRTIKYIIVNNIKYVLK